VDEYAWARVLMTANSRPESSLLANSLMYMIYRNIILVRELRKTNVGASWQMYRASRRTRFFLFTEYFSFGGWASAARSKEKYSPREDEYDGWRQRETILCKSYQSPNRLCYYMPTIASSAMLTNTLLSECEEAYSSHFFSSGHFVGVSEKKHARTEIFNESEDFPRWAYSPRTLDGSFRDSSAPRRTFHQL